jgi:serine/threonine-protein kinase
LITRSQLAATMSGLLPVLGTAKSIAPEQARGQAPDARTDIYQMGTLIYEVLAGRPPFEGDTAIDVIAEHLAVIPVRRSRGTSGCRTPRATGRPSA